MMRPSEDKGCYSYGSSAPDALSSNSNNSSSSFEFHKGNGPGKPSQQHRKLMGAARAKPTPSKWDDAQKWLVGFSGVGDHGHSKNKPRNSNADDRRLLNSASQKGRDSCSSVDGLAEDIGLAVSIQDEGETKKIDCGEAFWRINRPNGDCPLAVRSVCVRDMGTEMTPVASQEPSRTATPLRATSPALRSPISSRSPSPGRNRPGPSHPPDAYLTNCRNVVRKSEAVLYGKANGAAGRPTRGEGEAAEDCKVFESSVATEQPSNHNSLESRAMEWDEAERAKYMARYNTRRSFRMSFLYGSFEPIHLLGRHGLLQHASPVKAERLKARAQERLTNKLAATRRIAEEKRANAEAKLNEQAAKTAERADYIRRTGHLPSSFFSFRLPSLCG
ncbi:hypothetical protein Taro_042100 [Colocasia esculenta]|uniref:Remorin C-terminal domain-containing protein n=1 Tax=Colocasia esculenta TaxID=4460 RepID=A0A843WXP3_COLES|nr:hypothetical protein [Colocasia esculenta]